MKIKFDQEVDILVLRFSEKKILESDEVKPGVILDFDKEGNIVKIEILDASKRMAAPFKLEYEVASA
jgi:uncharacterized protein YuzE